MRLQQAREKNATARALGYRDFFDALPALYAREKSLAKTAQAFSITHTTVAYRLKQLGVARNPCGGQQDTGKIKKIKTYDAKSKELGFKDFFDACKRLYASGKISKEIGKIIGCSHTPIRSALRAQGIKMRLRGGGK